MSLGYLNSEKDMVVRYFHFRIKVKHYAWNGLDRKIRKTHIQLKAVECNCALVITQWLGGSEAGSEKFSKIYLCVLDVSATTVGMDIIPTIPMCLNLTFL